MSYAPIHFACWFEIPVRDLEKARAFYAEVFQMDLSIDEAGPNPVVYFPTSNPDDGVSGHLYPGKPSGDGPTVHLVVPDSLAETAARLTAAGGKVVSLEIEIPAGAFIYATDLDGNSIGLFKQKT
jgi:predicted enzyme related to lactoylglutathione lyase